MAPGRARGARRVVATAVLLALLSAGPAAARTRTYWIAAVPTHWDIVPNGRDAIEGRTFTHEERHLDTVVYRRFTRGWGRQIPRGRDAHEQGIIGPVLRSRVGDRVVVHFRNDDTRFGRPHSLHVHGMHYPFASDGAFIPGFSGAGANVRPGQSFTYRFTAGEDSRGVWPYHDHSPSMTPSIAGGMYGAITVLGPHERPSDREFFVFFGAVGGFSTINGRAFVGNTPVFSARVGETVQWNVLSLGDEFHTFHPHGHRWLDPAGEPRDTQTIGPAESFAVRWREDRPGTWLYHCHVESHMAQGMIGLYRVRR